MAVISYINCCKSIIWDGFTCGNLTWASKYLFSLKFWLCSVINSYTLLALVFSTRREVDGFLSNGCMVLIRYEPEKLLVPWSPGGGDTEGVPSERFRMPVALKQFINRSEGTPSVSSLPEKHAAGNSFRTCLINTMLQFVMLYHHSSVLKKLPTPAGNNLFHIPKNLFRSQIILPYRAVVRIIGRFTRRVYQPGRR